MDSRSLSHTTGYLRGHLERFPSFMWRLNQVFQNKTSLFLTPNYNRCFLRLNRACPQLCDESEIEKINLNVVARKSHFQLVKYRRFTMATFPTIHNPKKYLLLLLLNDKHKERVKGLKKT